MIAMQYTIGFPADYDMAGIDQRIRDKGPSLDGFPHLRFKAYLSARKAEKLYAPFYLWDDIEGLNDFLCGPGFAVLSRDLGRPSVQTWSVWSAEQGTDLRRAKFATREISAIEKGADLSQLRKAAVTQAQDAIDDGALASTVGFDPTGWTKLHFQLWQTPPTVGDAVQVYDVGYVALP